MHLYSARDLKAAFFGAPTVFRTDEDAARGFFDACRDKSTMLGTHSEDYAFYRIGDFDNQTGVIVPCAPVQVASGLEFLNMEPLASVVPSGPASVNKE